MKLLFLIRSRIKLYPDETGRLPNRSAMHGSQEGTNDPSLRAKSARRANHQVPGEHTLIHKTLDRTQTEMLVRSVF